MTLIKLNNKIAKCHQCQRLVTFREKIASQKRRQFIDEEYWGKPITGYGDSEAQLLMIGLAPAAHGGNRTGRVFTGDKSSEFLFQFPVALTPLQKLQLILKDPLISPDNPQKSEIAHYVSKDKNLYGISYKAFLRHRENDYMGCEVINGFMHLLEEKYNNMGKNKFFSHQFFPTVFLLS